MGRREPSSGHHAWIREQERGTDPRTAPRRARIDAGARHRGRGAHRRRGAGGAGHVRRRRVLQGQGGLPERRPARARQRGARRRPADRHDLGHRARRHAAGRRHDGGQRGPRAPARGHQATIRATSLSGIANRYISLQPGPNDAEEIDDGGGSTPTTPTRRSTSTPCSTRSTRKTREGLRNFVRGSGDQYAGKAQQAAESIKYFAPFLSTTTDLTRELALDQKLLERFVRDASTTRSAIAERRDDLAAWWATRTPPSGRSATRTWLWGRRSSCCPARCARPTPPSSTCAPRSTTSTCWSRSRSPPPSSSRPSSRAAPARARGAPDGGRPAHLIRTPGPDNDLTELTAKQPRLAQLTATVFPRAIRALDRSQPVVEYARGYTPDIAGWITKFAEVGGLYDANGHYARVQPVFSRRARPGGRRARGVPPTNAWTASRSGSEPLSRRLDPAAARRHAPVGVQGCDPSTTPPGP